MQPEVISDTKQIFNGKSYYLCGEYFQRDGERLHRTVWEYHNGPLPEGREHHVHHVDENKSNNNSGNLELMIGSEHIRLHNLANPRPLPKEALIAAAEWHGSDKGVEWHKAHYERHGHAMHAKTKEHTCKHCGKAFKSSRIKKALFCGRNCKAAARKASGVDNEARNCETCGEGFTVNKYAVTKTCSRSCASRAYWKARKAE